MTRILFPLALAVMFLFAGCGKPPGPEEAARTFFDQIATGHADEAYESGAFAFKAQQSEKFFETMLKELGLNTIKTASFDTPEMEPDGRSAKVRADFTIARNAKVALVVTLTEENGAWRVFALKSPRNTQTGMVENRFSLVGRPPDVGEAVSRQSVPDEAAIKKLVREWLVRFDDALEQKSFLDFFEKCSLGWQDQLVTGEVVPGQPRTMKRALTDKQKEIGASRLYDAFKPFIDKEVRLNSVKEVEPVLDQPPEVTTDGLLVVVGHSPTQPYTVVYKLKFQYEVPKWKLFGIDISLKK